MAFDLHLDTDNASFEDDHMHDELIHIFAEIVTKIDDGDKIGDVIDLNGNRIGTWSFT